MDQQRVQLLLASIEEERHKLAEARRAFVAEPCADDNENASHHENIHVVSIFMQRAQARLRHLERSMTELEHQPGSTTCQECGGEINPERLAARPDTVRCIRCQEEWEEEQQRTVFLADPRISIGVMSGFY